jgi:hypothetical protein
LAAAVLAALATATPAAAQLGNRQPPNRTLYEGLLASDFVVQDNSATLTAEPLRGRKVVLIASADFNWYAEDWNRTWGEGGRADRCILCRLNSDGVAGRQGFTSVQVATDPVTIAGSVAAALQPYVGEIVTAPDFNAAREMGGEYYVIIEYWAAHSPWGGRYRAHGGFQILNSNLERVFDGMGPQINLSVPCFEVRCTEVLYPQAISEVFQPGLTRLTTQLGPPPQ